MLPLLSCAAPGAAAAGDRSGASGSLEPVLGTSPSSVPPVSWVMAHHKSGFELSSDLAKALKEQLDFSVHGPLTWFGQPIHLQPRMNELLHTRRCDSCHGKERDAGGRFWHPDQGLPLHPSDRLVNFIRDPVAAVVSGYLYHLAGNEAGSMAFVDGGERGGDLAQFLDAAAVGKYGLPTANADGNYPAYLQSLTREQGVVAEIVRTQAWDLPEMVAAFAAVECVHPGKGKGTYLNVCLEDLMGDRAVFEGTIARVVDHLGVPAGAHYNLTHLYAYQGPHSTSSSMHDEVQALVEKLDDEHFDGVFGRASGLLPCAAAKPQPGAGNSSLALARHKPAGSSGSSLLDDVTEELSQLLAPGAPRRTASV